jgi:FtsH-binding integral membrane protein
MKNGKLAKLKDAVGITLVGFVMIFLGTAVVFHLPVYIGDEYGIEWTAFYYGMLIFGIVSTFVYNNLEDSDYEKK